MALIKDTDHLSIPFQDIVIATNNFTTLIGRGGYGNVYKGELSLSGKLTTVAVKRLVCNNSGQGLKQFLTEIHLLSRYKHPNLVSLLGFSHEGKENVLVYEYAEHGSLDNLLTMGISVCPLTCKQLINICINAASGLDYLHNHVAENQRVIHRDIKSANILLDHNWKAMISDLGLSTLGRANEHYTFLITNPCGTYGYCDPVYPATGLLTKESDVYSFGVVLFEVLCGRLCFKTVNNEHSFLAPLAQRYYEEGKVHEIIDPAMKEQLPPDSLDMILDIAYKCLLDDRKNRPSMGLVVKKLKEALKVLEMNIVGSGIQYPQQLPSSYHQEEEELRVFGLMKRLNEDESWELFMTRLPSMLKPKFFSICNGSPQKVVLMAGLFSNNIIKSWPAVIDDGQTPDDVLSLCYNDLGIHSKVCLLYMTLYPKDYDIPVRRLLRLWLAEGFVKKKHKDLSPEDELQKRFKKLVCRNMIQITKLRSDNSPKQCRLVSLIHDYLLPKAQEINLFYIPRISENFEDAAGPFGIRRMVQHTSNTGVVAHQHTQGQVRVDPSILRSYVSFNFQPKDMSEKPL